MRKFMTLALLATILVVTGCSKATSDSGSEDSADSSSAGEKESAAPEVDPVPSPTATSPTSYWDILIGANATTPEVCASYDKVITRYENSAVKRINSMKGKLKNAYVASSYKRGKDWMRSDFPNYWDIAIQGAATRSLNSISGNRASELENLDAYISDSLQLCGFTDRYASTGRNVTKAQGTAERILAKAATKPWYSKGYREYSDGLAYKYTTFSGGDPCGYSACRFAKVTVESRDGCFSGLFGEMNFYDNSDTIRDWDIESVSTLYPGDRATLEFVSYTDRSSGYVRLTSLTCY